MIHHSYINCSCIRIGTTPRILYLSIVTQVNYGAIEGASSRCDWAPVGKNSRTVHVRTWVDKVWVVLSLVYIRLAQFEETLKRNLICFEFFFPWIHDRFMRMVHEIFHAMEKCKELWFYGSINIPTKLHGNRSKVIYCFNNNVHEISYPVVEWWSMCLLKLLQLFSKKGLIHEDIFFKLCVCWKGQFMKFDLLFVFVIKYYWIMFLVIWYLW